MHFKSVTSPAKLQSSVQQHRGFTWTSPWKPRVRSTRSRCPWHYFTQKTTAWQIRAALCFTGQGPQKDTTQTSLLCKTSKTLIVVNAPLNTYRYFALIHLAENGKLVTSVFRRCWAKGQRLEKPLNIYSRKTPLQLPVTQQVIYFCK